MSLIGRADALAAAAAAAIARRDRPAGAVNAAPASGTSSGVAATAAQRDAPGVKAAIRQPDRHAGARHGDVHLVARDEAQVAGPGTGRRRGQVEGNQDFALAQRVRPGRGAEVFDRDLALAFDRSHSAGGTEGDQRRHCIGTGRGIAEVAAHRGPPLDLRAADHRDAVDQRRILAPHGRVGIDAIARHRRAQRQAIAGIVADLVEFGNRLDINHDVVSQASGAHLHQQIRAASQRSSARAMFSECLQASLQRGRAGSSQSSARAAASPGLAPDRHWRAVPGVEPVIHYRNAA